MDSNVVISAHNVTVEYKVSEHKITSIKEYLLQVMRRRLAYRSIRALNHIDIEVRKGESVALIGHNGCGKSTLLKVLAGIIQPPGAQVDVKGRIAPMIELGAGFDFELSGLENIRLSCMLMGLTSAEIDERTDQIIDFAQLREFIHLPLKNYSSGMCARLGFACATAVDPEVLLVDEVLSVGDSNFAKKCLDRIQQLRERGTTVVIVSHDATTVRKFCDRGYVIEKGELKFVGSIEEALFKHEEIMGARFIEGMSEAQKKEALRRRKMAIYGDASSDATRPKCKVTTAFRQKGQDVEEIDFAQPFSLQFSVEINGSEHFRDGVAFGFGINALSSIRIFGGNTLEYGSDLDLKELRTARSVKIHFDFDRGLPELAPGVYTLLFAIHDDDISREIFFSSAAQITATNHHFGINKHGDLIDGKRYLTRASVQIDEVT